MALTVQQLSTVTLTLTEAQKEYLLFALNTAHRGDSLERLHRWKADAIARGAHADRLERYNKAIGKALLDLGSKGSLLAEIERQI